MNLDGDDDNVDRYEVVYVPESVAYDFIASSQPDVVLANNVTTPTFWTNMTGPPDPTWFVVVATVLPVRIEGGEIVSDHGYQATQPMVIDPATGSKAFKPSYKAAGVKSTTDWVDAPPTGYASVGMWSFQKHSAALVGLSTGLRLKVAAGQDPSLQSTDATVDLVFGFPWMRLANNWWSDQRVTYDPATPPDLTAYVAQVSSSPTPNGVSPYHSEMAEYHNGLSIMVRNFQNGVYFTFVLVRTPPTATGTNAVTNAVTSVSGAS